MTDTNTIAQVVPPRRGIAEPKPFWDKVDRATGTGAYCRQQMAAAAEAASTTVGIEILQGRCRDLRRSRTYAYRKLNPSSHSAGNG